MHWLCGVYLFIFWVAVCFSVLVSLQFEFKTQMNTDEINTLFPQSDCSPPLYLLSSMYSRSTGREGWQVHNRLIPGSFFLLEYFSQVSKNVRLYHISWLLMEAWIQSMNVDWDFYQRDLVTLLKVCSDVSPWHYENYSACVLVSELWWR